MANGGCFNEQQWQKLEMPLLAVDSIISEFAEANGLEVTRNHKDWPERSIVWINNNVRCLIQLYLAGLQALGINKVRECYDFHTEEVSFHPCAENGRKQHSEYIARLF